MARFVSGFVAALVLIAAGGLAYIYSGSFDVRASSPHGPLLRWVLGTTMQRAIEVNADDVGRPPPATEVSVQNGGHHFAEMCVTCHGAPGVAPAEIAEGLNPHPPDLGVAAKHMTGRELFWIVKNGIKMSGMPSIGKTHDDETIWDIVAFVQKLPGMTPAQYQAMNGRAAPATHGEGGGQAAPSHGDDHDHR